MTQTNREQGGSYTGGPGNASEQSLASRIAGWQRVALYIAAGGAATILVCALDLARPLPSVAPPPSGVAPLLSSTFPPQSTGGGNSVLSGVSSTLPATPANSDTPPAAAPMNAQAYLAFVRQIDQQRGAMLASFDAALAGAGQNGTPQEFAGPNSPAGAAAAAVAQTAQSVQAAFQAQPAPAECSALSTAYTKLLQDQCGMVAQAVSSISSGDLRSASALATGAQRQIQSDALAADQALEAAAAALQSDKPFVITADQGQAPGSAPTLPEQPGFAPSGNPNGGGSPATPQPAGTAEQMGRTDSYAPSAPVPNTPSVPQPGNGQSAPNTNPTPVL